MTEQDVRFECLRLAVGDHRWNERATDVVGRARDYTDFVLGRRDAEIVRAATEMAAQVDTATKADRP